MKEKSSLIDWAIRLVSKSIVDNQPYDIDDLCSNGRCIVEFSGKEENVLLSKAEILDSDWELDLEATQLFIEHIERLLDLRKRECKLIISQAKQIKKDRLEELGLYGVL